MEDLNSALIALENVDFNWTTQIKKIWLAPSFDVPQLHERERKQILDAALELKQSNSVNSPLGYVVGGSPGVGKTHLLSAVRQQAAAYDIGFILVDMTDVRNFWETVLQGYVSSLREDSEDGVPQFQLQKVVQHLIKLTGHSEVTAQQMARLSAKGLNNGILAILRVLNREYPNFAVRFQDVVRALVLLNSENFSFSDVGYSWLSGLEIDAAAQQEFRFRRASQPNLIEIVEGLSWLLSLYSPWILALDQLDAIVAQHHYARGVVADAGSQEQQVSKAIIEGIGGGLMALRDKTCRTLTVISCLRKTWEILIREVVQSFRDRFRDEVVLMPISQQNLAAQLIVERIQPHYQEKGVKPPYPTWPFHNDFLADAAQKGKSARQILQRCDHHRQKCLNEQDITELTSFSEGAIKPLVPPDFPTLDQAFAAAQRQVDIAPALDEAQEDSILGQWLQTAGKCLVLENPTLDAVDTAVDINFPGGRNYPQLHARVRLIYREQGDREKHLSLRALMRSHHAAYRARLKTAMTTAGIDHALSFRRLIIVRMGDLPGGAATQALTHQFTAASGLMVYLSEAELRILGALNQIQQSENFGLWLRQRRPVSQLPCFQASVTWLFDDAAVEKASDEAAKTGKMLSPRAQPTGSQPGAQTGTLNRGNQPVVKPPSDTPTLHPPTIAGLPIGQRQIGQREETISIPLDALTKHTVVLAGSGAGKTVLVRRLVEEAVLQNIPAIVIDGANDLARMGDAWPEKPEAWDERDRAKARQYHQSVDVVVWTPGREAGNAVNFSPLPDFAALKGNADELNQAIDMACDSLQDVVAPGRAAAARIKQGILRNALEHFASLGGGKLESFAEFLSDLPAEATGNIDRAEQRAKEMADLLRAEMATNPLLRQQGTTLDPSILLGVHRSSAKTRLSVLNFVGLPGLPQQQQFLNQLAMTLFTWIKKNPAPAGQPLRGLLVIDEAKDFVPATGSTPCKSSLNRLAAQARKYGLGLIFATQAPKSIDHNVIANCSTQFYGRANSPAAIQVVQDQLRQRGGHGNDIAQLERGQFYAASEAINPPIKITAPLCLSYHPANPLDESEVLKRAKQSRQV